MIGKRGKILLTLCFQLISVVLIESWILRLPCIDDESKIFTTIMPGYALENHVIARYHRMNVEECKRMCFDELQCRSINHSDQNVCELNDNINQTSNQGDFKAKPGSTYITTNYSSKNMGMVCQALNPCTDASFCIDKCTSPGYRCVYCPKYHEVRYEPYCQLKDFVNRFFELRNIAVGKLAVGSSTCNYYLDDRKIVYFLFRISFANDGDFSCYNPTDLFKYFSTFYETNPYWMVDLEKPAVVLNVTVQSLGGGYTSWINPFDIRVGNEAANGGSDNPICFFGATLADGEKKNFTCPESEGRYVSINLPRKEQLLLCEVEVYGIFL